MLVNVRELKAHLSKYLRRMRQGETVEVTSHGKAIAQVAPPRREPEPAAAVLRRQPWVTSGVPADSLGLERPIVLRGKGPTLTELLLEDRE